MTFIVNPAEKYFIYKMYELIIHMINITDVMILSEKFVKIYIIKI